MELVTNFTSALRILACERCGAPLDVPTGGGSVRCTFCGASMTLEPRGSRALAVEPIVAEGERFKRLWEQTHIPARVSQVVARFSGLTVVATIPPERVGEALAIWRQLLVHVQGSRGDPSISTEASESAEDLVALTRALTFQPDLQGRRLRGMAESVLEAVSAPHQRHEMLGMLSNAACREHDGAGALGWLGQMSSRSPDLRVDSVYRGTHAVYETLRGAFGNVVTLLGARHEDVPMHSHWVLLATLFRANAFARVGDVEGGRAQLARLPASVQSLLPTVCERWRALALFGG